MVVATAELAGCPTTVAEKEAELSIGGLALVTRQLEVPVSKSDRLREWADKATSDMTPPKETQDDLLFGRVIRLPEARSDGEPTGFHHLGSVMLLERNGEELYSPYPNLILPARLGEHCVIEPIDQPPAMPLQEI